jgi:hypothetical protein
MQHIPPQFRLRRWGIIYSKNGVGCAFEQKHDEKCQGYVSNDTAMIMGNVILYSSLHRTLYDEDFGRPAMR